MNIGETDADGWTYVRFGDAAKAAQEGTHEVQRKAAGSIFWVQDDDIFHKKDAYKIREKARTITVTIPCPQDYANVGLQSIQLICKSQDDLKQTRDAIRAAMEQS